MVKQQLMPESVTINNQRTPAIVGCTLFDHAELLGIRVPTSCQKQGKCKECLVEVTQGSELLSDPTEAEAHLQGDFRLSCQCRVLHDTGPIHCHTLRRGEMRIERRAVHLASDGASLPLEPAVTRAGGHVLIDGQPVDRYTGTLHGIAMDLGTTTVVLRLYNLETGELIADSSFENPQRFAGSDVMARIHYDSSHQGHLLMRTLAGYLTHEIVRFPVDANSIYEMVVVGNATMRDLFFRQDVHPIGQNPYQSITEIQLQQGLRTTTSLTSTGKKSLLPINPLARVYGLPVVSGHVGADAAACMLAIDLAHEERLVALMDIGTNTELIVGNRHRILAASCPAGPAFEGGAIACGMPGLEGAVEKVALRADGSIQCEVIGGGAPLGICGSGLIDLLSELVRLGMMNELGRFEDDLQEFFLDAERKLFFLESDCNELAQAKGANVAGLFTVFDRYGIRFDEVEVFYLAGGFGRHLNIDAARRIGLVPNLPDQKFVQIGNAAIEGASLALLSASRRSELEALVRSVEHCRLETHPQFFDYFVDGCQFRPVGAFREVVG